MKIIAMIPARMNSRRFKGKVIHNILGKPMIYWVYKAASKVDRFDSIYVATSDIEIKEVCDKYNIPVICNPTNETTAAEKIALESHNIDGDIFINIQGDEPLVEVEAINKIIDAMESDEKLYYVGLKSKISKNEYNDPNVVKVVCDKDNYAMYFSRSNIPSTYDKNNSYRVMGLYGYRKDFLPNFIAPKSDLEKLENGIEMLRVMELGYKIKLLDTTYKSIGVDIKEHIKIVEDIMLSSNNYGEYTDLYDDNKKKTDKKLFREKGTKLEVPNGYYNIVVLAFIKNSKGEYLIQKTSKNKKGVYAVTGGHVKSGETSLDAIINEIDEELGIKVDKKECKLFKTYKYESAFKDVFYIKKDIDLKKVKYSAYEVEFVKYMSVDEINKLIKDNKFRKTNIDAFNDIISNNTL